MKNRLLSFTAGLLSLAVCVSIGEAQWNYLPAGQAEVDAIVADTAGERMLISTPGGCWLTENGGESWSPLGDHLDFPTRYGGGTFQIFDPYAGNIFAQIKINPRLFGVDHLNFLSSNGGQTWTLPPGLGTRQGIVQPWKQDRNVWLNLDYGHNLYISSDQGLHWSVASGNFVAESQPYRIYEDPLHDSTLYALSYYYYQYGDRGGGLQRTTDLGASWTRIFAPEDVFGVQYFEPRAMLRTSSGRLIITHGSGSEILDNNLLISDDDGVTWDSVATPALYFIGQILEVHSMPGQIIATAYTEGGIIISPDNGSTWFSGGEGLPDYQLAARSLTQNEFGGPVYLSPLDGNFYKSSNGGSSWEVTSRLPQGGRWDDTEIHVLPESVCLTGYPFDEPNRGWLLGAQDHWEALQPMAIVAETSSAILAVVDKQLDTLTALSYRHVPFRFGTYWSAVQRAVSHDNGQSWEYAEWGPQGYLQNSVPSVVQRDDTTTIILKYQPFEWSGDGDSAVISNDFGRTWQGISQPWTRNNLFIHDMIYFHDAWIATIGGNYEPEMLVRSFSNGQTWDTLSARMPRFVYHLLAVGDDIVFVSADSSYLFDDGTMRATGVLPNTTCRYWYCWNIVAIPATVPLIAAYPRSRDTLFVSDDYGTTWSLRLLDLPFDSQWYSIGDFTYDPYRNRLWLSTGIGPCYLDVAQLLSADDKVPLIPADYDLLSVYPNPFNNETTIRYELLKEARVQIELYDISGRLALPLAEDVVPAGKHELKLNARNLASGIYFVNLQAGDLHQTEKIALLK